MSSRVFIIGVVFILALAACNADEAKPTDVEPAQKPTEAREWVVKWTGEPDPAFLETVEVLRENVDDNTMLVKVNSDIDQEKWRAKWVLNEDIEYIQPNFQYKLNTEHGTQYGEDDSVTRAGEPARDYFLGQTNVRQAWEVWEPKESVTIAVIDTGLDVDNPLFAPHIEKPINIIYPGESANDITPEDVLRPEEQGKTEEEISAMYADGDEGSYEEYLARSDSEAIGHGTSVTGVLLQMLGLIDGDNPVEATETSAKVMPIKVMGFTGGELEGGSDFDMSEAIRMAINRGADIISLSLGDWVYSKNARDAVELAENAGVLVVAAAGNRQGGANEPIFFPAAFPTVLAVGGTTSTGEYDVYSNHGPGLSLVAPGENIWTTNVGGTFRSMSGNSFATPQVTAVAAMVMQQNPMMSPAQVRNLLRQTADSAEGDWDSETGYGLLNAYRAVTELPRADIYEGNETQDTAARVSINDRVEAALEGPDDEDWFVYNLPNVGVGLTYHVNVQLKLPRTLQTGVELRIKQPGQTELATYSLTGSEELFLTVRPGDLYVSVRFQDGEPSRYVGYELETQVSMTPDPYEDNSHQWHAYELDLEEETFIEGTFHKEGDKDWYRIKTSAAGILNIQLSANSPRIDPVLFVQQLGGSGILVDEVGPMGTEQLQIRVEADGVYYIRVHDLNINPSLGKYELRLDYEPLMYDVNAPNSRSDQATFLPDSQAALSAAIVDSTDYDWYRFRVPQATEVTVYVDEMEEHVQAEVIVYDEHLQVLGRRTVHPDDMGVTWTEELPEGMYYVRVRPLSGAETTPYVIGYLLPQLGDVDERILPFGD